MADRPGGEAALCKAWSRRLWGDATLRTTDGQSLEVVYPGRRRGAPGPDFGGAIVARGSAGRLEHGDVEVHLRSSGWFTHGHQQDDAYAAVILHVVLIDDAASPPVRRDGTPLPTIVLTAYLPPDALAGDGLADGEVAQRGGPCRVAPGVEGEALLGLLEEAGRARIAAKAAVFEGDLTVSAPEEAGQVLFRGLLDAAGYSRNRVPCRALADRMPLRTLQALCAGQPGPAAQTLSEAVLLGMAGLLAEDDTVRQDVWAATRALWPGGPLHREVWQRAAVRPANRPEARLRGLATVVARTAEFGLLHHIFGPLRAGEAAPKKTAAALLATLTVRGDAEAALGVTRATEMLVNVVLPFAVAWAASRDEPDLAAASYAVLRVLPGGQLNDVLAAMQEIVAPAGCRVERLSALQQQGLLHLYARHCSLGDCLDCPLARVPQSGRDKT